MTRARNEELAFVKPERLAQWRRRRSSSLSHIEVLEPDGDISSAFVDAITCFLPPGGRTAYIDKLRAVRAGGKQQQPPEVEKPMEEDPSEVLRRVYALDFGGLGIVRARDADIDVDGMVTVAEVARVTHGKLVDGTKLEIRQTEPPLRDAAACSARLAFYDVDDLCIGVVDRDALVHRLPALKGIRGETVDLVSLDRWLQGRRSSTIATKALVAAATAVNTIQSRRRSTHLDFKDDLRKSAERQIAKKVENDVVIEAVAPPPSWFRVESPRPRFSRNKETIPMDHYPRYVDLGWSLSRRVEMMLSSDTDCDAVLRFGIDDKVVHVPLPVIVAFSGPPQKSDGVLRINLFESLHGAPLAHASLDVEDLLPQDDDLPTITKNVRLVVLKNNGAPLDDDGNPPNLKVTIRRLRGS